MVNAQNGRFHPRCEGEGVARERAWTGEGVARVDWLAAGHACAEMSDCGAYFSSADRASRRGRVEN